MLIGISGYKQSGKDSVAAFIAESHERGYKKFSFAHKLKSICTEMFDIPMSVWEDGEAKETIDTRYHVTPRDILIKVGTDCFRTLHPNVWVEACFSEIIKAECGHAVISDVRFQNEADSIIREGGVIIRVVRPGYDKGEDVGDIDWSKTPHACLDNNHTLLVLKLKTQALEREMYKSIEEVKGIA